MLTPVRLIVRINPSHQVLNVSFTSALVFSNWESKENKIFDTIETEWRNFANRVSELRFDGEQDIPSIMESDEIIREIISMEMLSREMCTDGGGSAKGEKKTPKKRLTEAELIVRGILWDIYLKVTRWDQKYDYSADPHTAPESNVFDSHCHIDRYTVGIRILFLDLTTG